ncbi:cytochrome c-type biogenesis protein CcmH [Pseudogemmatithrix spongiicola]|uniref:Cytochrome c-type biogenesis protein n=1 Tax=Pseudogemmatithrix spongiicola TaxID=3062599 RepID=A0AA49Q410_9BACT|nr:cytochrome c-type biogenesis protein CcmH [Gemmatimonadaceae bacterium 'strain 138']WKW14278.1 cytochrome c-type biogenesis protein CcmH [Gemmatimonadaceae bacterium 'strain 318']
MLTRREWFVAAAGAGAVLTSRVLSGQGQPTFTPMDQGAYRPVLREPKPGAQPSMTPLERDQLERTLKCQCTCILDVYTCRTTDFTCSVSPAMHRDVMRLVEGGFTAQEIKDAFVATYGEVALTAPVKQGFNWAGYFAPAVVMTTGGIILTMMIKRWTARAAANAPVVAAGSASAAVVAPRIDASADEMARLEKALREEDFE